MQATAPKKINKILLLNPFMHKGDNLNIGIDMVVSRHAGQQIKTGVTFPIGLAYMGAVLKEAGFTVRLVDPIAQKIPAKTIYSHSQWADAIIMPFSPAHSKDMEDFLSIFKDKFRILGGGIAPYIHSYLFSENLADVVIKGEPEETVVELITRYPYIEEVEGIIFRCGDGSSAETPDRPTVSDLDSIPFPIRDFAPPSYYWDISFYGRATAWILPARGCTYNCIFCAQRKVNDRKVRRRSPVNIADEIQEVITRYEVRRFVFFDETFNLDPAYAISVCDEILKRDMDIQWWCSARPDLVTYETASKMREAGCIEMRFGIESADNEILRFLKKNTTAEKMQRGIDITRKAGINFSFQCIFGSPMETRETIKKTVKFIKTARPLFVSFNILTPLPGSMLFDSAKDSINLTKGLKSFDIVHTDYSLCSFSSSELSDIVREAYRNYYLSPSFFIRLTMEFIKNPLFVFGIIRTVIKQGVYVYRSIISKNGSQ